MQRVGIGYDSHRFEKGRKLVLGGVYIPESEGLAGHSDADVLIHALMDALLGAAGMRDIGVMFPDDDLEWKDASSRMMLRMVMGRISLHWKIANIDSVIIAEKPRLSEYVEAMRKNISEDCGIKVENVSVKATTNEGMGFVGKGEGMAVMVNVLLGRFK